jgi:probable phosphoglycerate mutase
MAREIAATTKPVSDNQSMPNGDLFAAEASTNSRTTGGTVLAHCDGGARGNPGPAGYGAVIATEDGTVLAELSEFLGHKTNNYAEYSGLLGVLQWALDHGHRRVRLVSDSELMVKQIQGKYKVNSPDLKPLWEEAKRRIAKLEYFNISHALRHKNKTADRLANEAMDRGMGRPAAAPPLKAIPYPTKSSEPPAPKRMDPLPPEPRPSAPSAGEMLRGFVRDGSIVLLGGKTLPDGVFVKVIRE